VIAVEDVSTNRPLQPADWARCIGELPSLPRAFVAAVEVLGQDHAPASACIDAIERDQALTVRVLHLANSAFYGAPGKVSRVGDAVQMLGLRTVANTLAALSLRTTLTALQCKGFPFEAYWRHSLCTAISAREFAKRVSLDTGEAFLLGLLHDVGRLILAVTSPALEARALQRYRQEGMSMHEAEQRVFGVSHTEVGAAVTRQWNFPPSITDAVLHHHQPAALLKTESIGMGHLLHLANAMAHGMEGADPALPSLVSDPLWPALRISALHLHALADQIAAELNLMSRA
jgi:putative nucleotidyltransferase with HDIG domain